MVWCLIISFLLACLVGSPVGGALRAHLPWMTHRHKASLTNRQLTNSGGIAYHLHSGRQSLRLPQLPSFVFGWAVNYGPHKEGRRELGPEGPSGVAAFKAAQAQGRSWISPPLGSSFETPQPGPPKGDQTGPRGGFNLPFLPFSLPFLPPLGPRPLRAGLTNSHMKIT